MKYIFLPVTIFLTFEIAATTPDITLIINFFKRVVIAHFNFKAPVTAFAFSPDSRFFAVSCGKKFKIFESPSVT